MRRFLIAASIAVGISIYLFWPQPEEIIEEPKDDTGLTREETEDFMRKIGYVQ